MAGPGTGRYTTYIPIDKNSGTVDRYITRKKLFNDKSASGGIYTGNTVTAVADQLVKDSIVAFSQIDVNTFPDGVTKDFSGAPDVTTVKWSQSGDPANPYVPDLSSPGAGKTSGTDKDADPKISTTDVKPNFVSDAGTTSPSSTATTIGSFPIGKDLKKGKSSV